VAANQILNLDVDLPNLPAVASDAMEMADVLGNPRIEGST
jgi:hypothetical protein